MRPDWFVLIEQWVPRGMGKYGPTLPFVVGALAHKTNEVETGMHHIEKLLDDIVRVPIAGYVTQLSWCANISAPVLTTRRMDDRYRMRSPISLSDGTGTAEVFVFGQDLISRWKLKDASTALDRVKQDAAGPVEKRQYSRNWSSTAHQDEYGDFLPGEIQYIQDTIITPDARILDQAK